MEFLKSLFENAENGTMNFEQLQSACKEANIKLANLANGEYVAKQKYDDDISAKAETIKTLEGTIKSRDSDIKTIRKELEEAGDNKEKLTTLSTNLSDLQTKYKDDIAAYKSKLEKQSYEYAVKDFANSKKFTSKAAKRDFVNSMMAKELKMDNDTILGAEDFVNAYSAENADAFVVENPTPKPNPQFVNSTPGPTPPDPNNTNGFKFNFTGVRPHKN